LKGILTTDIPISKEFSFEGTINLLLVGGLGSLTVERSVDKSEYYPLSTDTSGGQAVFDLNGGCVYNGSLEEKSLQTSYRLRADLTAGEVEYVITRAK